LIKKRIIHKKYISLLKKNNDFDICPTPDYSKNNKWLNILKINNSKKNNKKNLILRFLKNNIFVRPIWKLNHLQKQFKNCQTYRIKNAIKLHNESICLPSSYHLKTLDLERVISILN
jgi:dTDP-4-amino-4,6-dideoxygalactose transaminase